MSDPLPYNALVVIGPESTGKTTLAAALGDHFNWPVVEEYSRHYLAALGRPYTEADLPAIAQGQSHIEEACRAMANLPVVCDTDAVTVKIWQEYKYHRPNPAIDAFILPQPARLYLLCAPDLTWQPDPLRENPHDREAIFHYHLAVLNALGAHFAVVDGKGTKRLENALRIFDQKAAVVSSHL